MDVDALYGANSKKGKGKGKGKDKGKDGKQPKFDDGNCKSCQKAWRQEARLLGTRTRSAQGCERGGAGECLEQRRAG